MSAQWFLVYEAPSDGCCNCPRLDKEETRLHIWANRRPTTKDIAEEGTRWWVDSPGEEWVLVSIEVPERKE